jgi:predicted transcriptional regulator YdeE
MAYSIITRAALTIAGFSSEGAGPGIAAAWQQLAARRADWPSDQLYGVGQPTMTSLRFLAGVLVPAGKIAPAGLEVIEVPAGRYFSQPYRGDRRKLAQAVMQLYSSVIPAASEPFALPMLFVAEYVGDVSDPGQTEIECELYIHLA